MSHSSSFCCCKTKNYRNCHNLLMSSRVRRDMMADRLDSEWQELRQHASIERDTEKLLRLTAEFGKRKADVCGPRAGN